MSRVITVNKSNPFDTATLKTPNFKEIVPAQGSYDPNQTQNQTILMDEFGQTPDHYYLASKKPPTPTFFQVKRKLDLQPIDTIENTRATRNKSSRKIIVPERVRGKGVDKPRYDTSLGQLTKKFLKLLSEAAEGVLNLNTACTILNVPKRRLYDITNVLEGAGLIQKSSRNNIQWRGSSPHAKNGGKHELEREIDLLEAKENKLDELIYNVKSHMNSVIEEDAKYHYVTPEDILHIEEFAQKLLIGVKTSPSVQVVESNTKTFFIRSKSTEIEAYLLLEDVPFANILHPKAALKKNFYEIKISNSALEYGADDLESTHIKEEETLCSQQSTHCTSKSIEDIYNPMCSGAVWSQGDTVIKNAFITEEDDIAPMGKHFLLQTEDQDLDSPLFTYLETSENYSFSLDDGEGLTDLFDCNFSCP